MLCRGHSGDQLKVGKVVYSSGWEYATMKRECGDHRAYVCLLLCLALLGLTPDQLSYKICLSSYQKNWSQHFLTWYKCQTWEQVSLICMVKKSHPLVQPSSHTLTSCLCKTITSFTQPHYYTFFLTAYGISPQDSTYVGT